jgi:hypothetical protein
MASGVPVGSKNEFDLKHYIDDLKCFETIFFCLFFFQIGGGGRTLFGKFQIFFIFDPFPKPMDFLNLIPLVVAGQGAVIRKPAELRSVQQLCCSPGGWWSRPS